MLIEAANCEHFHDALEEMCVGCCVAQGDEIYTRPWFRATESYHAEDDTYWDPQTNVQTRQNTYDITLYALTTRT